MSKTFSNHGTRGSNRGTSRRWLNLAVGLGVSAILLGSCAVGPNYKRPAVNAPSNFRDATEAATNTVADLPWWQVFQDETLQGLIRTALTNNYDLRIAIARVEQAQAIALQSRLAFFPQLNYQASANRGRNAVNGNALFNHGAITNTFLIEGTASWEIDLWGRLRRLNEAAQAQYLASQEARRDVRISLISQAAQSYFQLLALDQELEIARRTTNSFAESLKIFGERMQGGVVSKLETASAEALLDSTAATVPELERQIALQENQISVLLGQNPGPIIRNHKLLMEMLPPEVPVGLPSALLERRPDIRETEQLLRSANALVGVSVADFFPQLSLTALFGQVSPQLSTLTAGGANAWNIGADFAGPIFRGGQLVSEYRQAKSVREQTMLQYQLTVLNALQEVSNALIARQKYAEERLQQARAVDAYRVAVQVATQRYVSGLASYYEVLQEQQLLFPAENSLTQTELNQLLAVVQLYRSLGGGWQSENVQVPDGK